MTMIINSFINSFTYKSVVINSNSNCLFKRSFSTALVPSRLRTEVVATVPRAKPCNKNSDHFNKLTIIRFIDSVDVDIETLESL